MRDETGMRGCHLSTVRQRAWETPPEESRPRGGPRTHRGRPRNDSPPKLPRLPTSPFPSLLPIPSLPASAGSRPLALSLPPPAPPSAARAQTPHLPTSSRFPSTRGDPGGMRVGSDRYRGAAPGVGVARVARSPTRLAAGRRKRAASTPRSARAGGRRGRRSAAQTHLGWPYQRPCQNQTRPNPIPCGYPARKRGTRRPGVSGHGGRSTDAARSAGCATRRDATLGDATARGHRARPRNAKPEDAMRVIRAHLSVRIKPRSPRRNRSGGRGVASARFTRLAGARAVVAGSAQRRRGEACRAPASGPRRGSLQRTRPTRGRLDAPWSSPAVRWPGWIRPGRSAEDTQVEMGRRGERAAGRGRWVAGMPRPAEQAHRRVESRGRRLGGGGRRATREGVAGGGSRTGGRGEEEDEERSGEERGESEGAGGASKKRRSRGVARCPLPRRTAIAVEMISDPHF